MTKTRRTSTDEFKREAVALFENSGQPLMQVAAELGIQPSMLRSWRAVVRATAPSTQAGTPASASAPPRRRSWQPRSRGSSASSTAPARNVTFKKRSRTGSACEDRNGFGLGCRRKGAASGFLVRLKQ
jgi:transposase-like protein